LADDGPLAPRLPQDAGMDEECALRRAMTVKASWHKADTQSRSRSRKGLGNRLDDADNNSCNPAAAMPEAMRSVITGAPDCLPWLHTVYSGSPDAVLVLDPRTERLLDANRRAIDMLSIDDLEQCAWRLPDLHDEDPVFLHGLIDDVMDSPIGRTAKIRFRASDGRTLPSDVALSRIEQPTGDLLLCVVRDVAERDDDAQRIHHMAYHDALTNLPNRLLLSERVERALIRGRRSGQKGALLFLDLDRFKRINDSLGHRVGDRLLVELAKRLRHALREADTVARLGGDEFVVLLEGLGQHNDGVVKQATGIAAKIRGVFADAFLLEGHTLYVTVSIGIATFPQDGDSVDQLLRHADTAMYHAKDNGRDAARLFEPRMDETAISRLRYENELRTGLEEGQFELYFQPILKIRTGQVMGAEVLLRWRHPTAGLISPSEFLPYIENSALMLQLDDWVIRECCRLLGQIQREASLHVPECLSVNISHQQFHQSDFVERMQTILEQTDADPARLQFEVTETLLIRDSNETIRKMNRLRQLGIRFSIDDFGTGYSSLSDLRQLPVDTIKIDQTFIHELATNPNDAVIVQAILSMAGHLGVDVVAEGVETREQLQFLRAAECRYYQGYLGRPPMSLRTFVDELFFFTDDQGPRLETEQRPL
jgi:diguanylate cyclase (GGDEF)-like protein